MAFALRARQARRRAGLSQAALAAKIGVARSAVAQWERLRGGTRPCNENLARFAVVTDVSHEWLCTGRGGMLVRDDEIPALLLNHYAHDELEERMLLALREVPASERQVFVDFVEAWVGQRRRVAGDLHDSSIERRGTFGRHSDSFG